MINKILISVFLILFLTHEHIGQNSILYQKFDHTIQNFMDSLAIPGLSVAVIQNDQTLFKKSFGHSNLEYSIPMTDTSVFRIWSVSKQFCAVSILKLYEENKIDLNDSIDKHLDSIPPNWNSITIKQLLNQTSGIKDYLNDYPEGRKLIGINYKDIVDSTKHLLFEPGTKWRYTNTGYWVLSKIVEKISGMSYQEFLREEFFNPLQLNNTQKMSYKNVIPNRVSGYKIINKIPQNSTRYLDEGFVADGDAELLSTLNDLIRWTKAVTSNKLIGDSTLNIAWEPVTLFDGDTANCSYLIYYDDDPTYGMGWFIDEINGKKIVWTPGAGRGFSTSILTVPYYNLSIIVLTNTRHFLIADKIARSLAINHFLNNNSQ